MLDVILQRDKDIILFLNNLGSEQWDSFWLLITNQLNWIPLFVFVFYLVIKTFGWKQGSFIILSMIVLVAFSDQFTNLIKNTVARLRPNNDVSISSQLRILITPQSYSFYSGHAATSTIFSVFVILLLRQQYKYIYLILLFPLVFSYSRLYLGVHFLTDILSGIIAGTLLANLYFYGYKKVEKRLFY